MPMINNRELLDPSKLSAAYHYLSGRGYLPYIQSMLRQQNLTELQSNKTKESGKGNELNDR